MLGRLLSRLFSGRMAFGSARFADAYAFYQTGDLIRAERASCAIGDAPLADIRFLQGLIARKRGERNRAAVLMAEAADLKPDELSFHLALGEILLELERYEEALAYFERYIAAAQAAEALNPTAYLYAGRCCSELGRLERARDYLGRALPVLPTDENLASLLAATQLKLGETAEARRTLEPLARRGVPGAFLRRALYLPPVYDSRDHIEEVRSTFERELDEWLDAPAGQVDDPATQIGVAAFFLAYHNRNNAKLMGKLCRAVRATYSAGSELNRTKQSRGSRIRVGFVSTFFRQGHAVGRVTMGLIRDLPRDAFEVHVFAIAPRPEEAGEPIARSADRYLALPAVLDDVRKAITDADLDVLIFADIGMHPLTYFLAMWRLAPLQAVWWGHPETTGLDTIDCFFSAAVGEIADAQSHYSEHLVRPDAFFLPGYEEPRLERRLTREDLGLSRDARLYACLQPTFKIHPDMDAVFAGILARDPKAEILLQESLGTSRLRARLDRTLQADASRVRIIKRLPVQDYLATLAVADVALDPLYFGGGNSSCDALAMAVPLVSLPGTHLYGRLTLGLYTEMQLSDCLATTAEDYVDVACRIAMDPEHRAHVSREIQERSKVVYGRKDITLAYAEFLKTAVWDAH